ncbi:hypothetical protein [Halalkalibacter alkaliphilus]|uniref:Uncharacterized protein n=1 Tax=Halalkalibacter alkaliphilus TaxID=2917993 RepID=A0A9X2IAJ0_9BACI|nr:hypothetical protein [Halalkalibacter alkaliphilus]MCL7749455.1 hypothetical protein [Halalkalibacter alkaliphilus]
MIRRSLRLIVIFLFLFLVGCSFGKISLDHAETVAIQFAEEYIDVNNLDIAIADVKVFDAARSDEENKWDVYLEVDKDSNEFDLSTLGWISVSDEEEVIEYYLWAE